MVVEDHAATGRAHEPVLTLDLGEALQDRDARQAEHVADESGIELEPEARRDVEQVALRLVEIGR